VLKLVRGNEKPFGGIQLILLGDFFQLPPVVNMGQERKFAFESQAWIDANLQIFMLQQVFRQHDDRFIALLANIRRGTPSDADLDILNNRKNVIDHDLIKPTILGTHNRQIMEVNNIELNKLTGLEKSFVMKGSGTDTKLEFLKKNCLAQEDLRLRVGAQVMMLKNTLQKEGIINGSLGIVKKFTGEGLPVVTFTNGKTLVIERDEWAVEEFNEETRKLEQKAIVRQIPLLLAWAITVHKSQGMTMEKISCDLAGSFEEGQIYVALSRVVSIEGLFLKSFNANLIKVNSKVVEFYNKLQN
jgi:ATP-dependent exoDNAse (exonuclease V) alpha subunit